MKHALLAAGLMTLTGMAAAQSEAPTMKDGYAEVNGLKMYYQIHGEGHPLVMVHGAFGTAESLGGLLPELTKHRQVIIVEMQAHGRTADIERPMTYESLVEDLAACLRKLEIKNADIFGYSMGGVIGTGLAVRHPDLVRNLAMIGSDLSSLKESYQEEMADQILALTPETFNFPEVKDPYTAVAPNPEDWPKLVTKTIGMFGAFKGYTPAELASIKARTLIMAGDSEGFRMPTVVGWYQAIPNANLAIYPGADHFFMFMHQDRFLADLLAFLNPEGPAQ